MTCPNCHSTIDDNNKYCNYCGKKIENPNEHENQFSYSEKYSNTKSAENVDHSNQYSYSMLYSNMYNNTVSSDEDYLKAYIGENYNTIKSKNFSIFAFLFGAFYLIYRKLWLYAIVLIIGELLLVNYLEPNTAMLVQLAIITFIGFKFNSFYLKHCEKEVEQIKISNPDKTSSEMLDICKKKGGTIGLMSVITISFILPFLIIFSIFLFLDYNDSTTKESNNDKRVTTPSENKVLGKMSYKSPKNTKMSNYSNNTYHYYITLDSTTANCSFSLTTNSYTNLYKTPDEYLNRNVFIENSEKELANTTTTINNIKWRYLSVGTEGRTENHYVTINNNTLYIIEIRAYGDSRVSTCKNAENELINSISFKTN